MHLYENNAAHIAQANSLLRDKKNKTFLKLYRFVDGICVCPYLFYVNLFVRDQIACR